MPTHCLLAFTRGFKSSYRLHHARVSNVGSPREVKSAPTPRATHPGRAAFQTTCPPHSPFILNFSTAFQRQQDHLRLAACLRFPVNLFSTFGHFSILLFDRPLTSGSLLMKYKIPRSTDIPVLGLFHSATSGHLPGGFLASIYLMHTSCRRSIVRSKS